LQFAGVGGDGHVASRGIAEGFAEKEVPLRLIVEEEAMKAAPGGARQTIRSLNEAVQIIRQGRHEPETEMYVDGAPASIGITRSSTLCHVIHDLVRGEEELEDLPPLREVGAGGIDLELDVIVDVNSQNRVGVGSRCELGGKNERRSFGGGRDHRKVCHQVGKIEGFRGGWSTGHWGLGRSEGIGDLWDGGEGICGGRRQGGRRRGRGGFGHGRGEGANASSDTKQFWER
jgi:hypothetical protein